MKLTYRLLLVVIAGLLPLIGVQAYNAYDLHQVRRAEVEQLSVRQAQLASSELDRLIEGVRGILRSIAQSRSIRESDAEQCARFLERLLPEIPYLTSVAYADADGTILCASSPGSGSIADRSYFQEALTSRDPVVGEFIIGKVSKVPMLPVAMALAERGQAPRGVLLATLNLTWLSEQILKRGIPEGGSVTVADRNGTIIARQPLPDRFVGTRIPDDFLHLLAEKAPSSLEVMSQDGTRRLLGYVPLAASPSGLYVSAGLSSEASFVYLTNANYRQLIVTALSIVAALLAAILAARYFVETPIQQIVDTCRRWQKGDTSARTALSARDGELGLIGEELDSAIGKLAARENTIQVLMRELEHRTKNQLSIVLALARQISKDVSTSEEFYQELTGRLQALAASHDILLRNEQRTGTIGEIIAAQLQLFRLGDSDRVNVSGPEIELPATEAQFLGMAFYELLTNAEKYGVLSSEKGRLIIKWHLTGTDQQSVELVWWESDGRAVAEPEKTGFGGMLVNKIVPLQLRGTASSSFGRDGFRWVIQFPLKAELAAS